MAAPLLHPLHMDRQTPLISATDAGGPREPRRAPKLTVVTVCRNVATTIRRTIESVLAQTYRPLEYIVIDGASTDGTLEIVHSFGDRIDRVVSEADGGIYEAMNKGIALATGEWIHLLNADDEYGDPNALARAVMGLDSSRTNYFAMYLQHADGRRDLKEFRFALWKLYVSAFLPHPALIVSRTQYREVGVYDSSYAIAADHDLILRLVRRYPPRFEPIPLVTMHSGGISSRDLALVREEFKRATVAAGLPVWVAGCIAFAKRVWWGS